MLCLLGRKAEEVGGGDRGCLGAGVNRGEKVIEIRQCEETEWWVCVSWGKLRIGNN